MPTPVRRFSGGADIHSHPLPAIDDGATSLRNAILMLAVAARNGTSILVATPHRYYGSRENTPELLLKLTAEVRAALDETTFGARFTLVPGQEIPLRLETGNELQRGSVLSIGGQGVYALVEPPFDHLPDWMAEAIGNVVAAGVRPVLAHPERNKVIQSDPERVVPLVEAGALLQLTAMSVTGENGARARAASDWILDRDLAAVVASDTHSPSWRPPTLRRAFHTLTADRSPDLAARLCIHNPRRIALSQPWQPE